MMPARRHFRNLFEREGESGAALVEFAIVAPVLVALLAGTVDLGVCIYNYGQVSSAAEAATLYAQNYGQTGQLADIQNAGDYASNHNVSISTPSCFRGCANNNQLTNVSSCTATLPTNCAAYGSTNSPGQYVQVSVSLNPTYVFNLIPGLPTTISRTVTVRTQ